MNPRTIGAGFVRNKVWDFLHEFSEPSAGLGAAPAQVPEISPGAPNEPQDYRGRICQKQSMGFSP